jgi:D-aspartate ligase
MNRPERERYEATLGHDRRRSRLAAPLRRRQDGRQALGPIGDALPEGGYALVNPHGVGPFRWASMAARVCAATNPAGMTKPISPFHLRKRRLMAASGTPLALVMGDVDLVRALGLAGISCAFVGRPDESARFSRHVAAALPWIDQWARQEELVAALVDFARSQPELPVLFPQTDATLLLASRYRERLAEGFRSMLADRELIEQLVDKSRFQELAARHALPVPRAERMNPALGEPPPKLDVPFPLVIKPLTRTPGWTRLAGQSKALHMFSAEDLAGAWPRLRELPTELLAQELISGPESRIESFHAYVDESGAVAGEFVGRKIRTFPADYGRSTAVEIVDLPDVARLGREVLSRLALRGVAKLDFKRDQRGQLHLLEINPRFNLWHYPGALAGVNLPATVYADLTGRPRPEAAPTPRPVRWCDPLQDLRAAHAAGISPRTWLRSLLRCQAISGLAWQDPLPFLRGKLWAAVWRRVAGRVVSVAPRAGTRPTVP